MYTMTFILTKVPVLELQREYRLADEVMRDGVGEDCKNTARLLYRSILV